MLSRRRFLTGAVAAGVTAAVAADGLLELAGDRKFFLPPTGGWFPVDFDTESMSYRAHERWSEGFTDPRGVFGQNGFGLAKVKVEGGAVSFDEMHLVAKALPDGSRHFEWVRTDILNQAAGALNHGDGVALNSAAHPVSNHLVPMGDLSEAALEHAVAELEKIVDERGKRLAIPWKKLIWRPGSGR
jgi:hypothetical protein